MLKRTFFSYNLHPGTSEISGFFTGCALIQTRWSAFEFFNLSVYVPSVGSGCFSANLAKNGQTTGYAGENDSYLVTHAAFSYNPCRGSSCFSFFFLVPAISISKVAIVATVQRTTSAC